MSGLEANRPTESESLLNTTASSDWPGNSNGRTMKTGSHDDVEIAHPTHSAGVMVSRSDVSPGKCGPFTWSILPITISVTSVVGFVVTYLLAKANCHVQKWILPFVSYTGTEHPESMVFGLLLNVEGFLGFTVVFLAWRYYRYMGQSGVINTVALVFGGVSCFGVVMVGNFQVTKGKVPHYIGAGCAFLSGNVYAYMATILSRASFRKAHPPLKFKRLVVGLRFALAGLMTASLLCLLGLVIYKKLTKKKSGQKIHYPSHPHNGSCEDILSSTPDSKKQVDLTASLAEWILTAGLLGFLSLFAYEFKTFQKVKVILLCGTGLLGVSNKKNGADSYHMFTSTTKLTEMSSPSIPKDADEIEKPTPSSSENTHLHHTSGFSAG